MHVIIITPEVGLELDVRGFIHGWISELAAQVEHVTVVALRLGKLQLPSNVEAYSLGHEGARLKTALRLVPIFWRIRKQRRIDLIFVHMMPKFAVLVGPVAWIFRAPIVLWYAHGAVGWPLRAAQYLVDVLVTPSPESCRISSPKVRVIGHGVDPELFQPAERHRESGKEAQRLLSIGRISPSKDYATVLRCLPALVREFPGLSYEIVGSPTEGFARDIRFAQDLRVTIRDLGIGALVRMTGSIPNGDVVRRYQSSDIFINPSLTGSLDKTGLEAMLCGIPTLSCNKSYMSLFGEYADLLYFEPGDTDGLSRRLVKLMRMPADSVTAMGIALRQRVKDNHSLPILMRRLSAIFNESARRTVSL